MRSSVSLYCIPPDQKSTVWPHVRSRIHDAMLRGGGDFASVEQGVLNGPDQLWMAWDGTAIIAAAVTSLGTINGDKVCTIVACSGVGWSRFGHFIDDLEQFAKDEGCTSVRINGRAGWRRVLKGYDVQSVVLRKEL